MKIDVAVPKESQGFDGTQLHASAALAARRHPSVNAPVAPTLNVIMRALCTRPARQRRTERAGAPVYSARSAIMGSTAVARRAGTHAANAAVSSSTVATAASVAGSVGSMPNRSAEMNLA